MQLTFSALRFPARTSAHGDFVQPWVRHAGVLRDAEDNELPAVQCRVGRRGQGENQDEKQSSAHRIHSRMNTCAVPLPVVKQL